MRHPFPNWSSHIPIAFFLLISLFLLPPESKAQRIEQEHLSQLSYRSVGPYRGGRSTAVTGIPGENYTFFMGTTGGGVWRTDDGGANWANITDGYLNSASIGAVEVAPSDHQVMYIGTGSACPRGNISMGDGVYKSTNGGKSWEHIGLKEAGLIGKIIIHPDNPDHLYVAVLGNIFGPNEQRGVFQSKDGGESWEKILYLSDTTGCVDMAIDPSNPRILYAGFWRAERKPWTFIDGGKEGGLYKSIDGGQNWEKVKGLPDGIGGRIGLTISPANPQRIWVIREMQKEQDGGVFRSDDGGKTWTRINREHKLRQRAWYYNHIYADPKDENTVYVMNTGFYKSIDGGKQWERISTPHGDNHGVWINPEHTDIMIECNDGGANVSYNGGRTWSTQYNQPTAEFYRVAVDHQYPYRLYGAQQDNSTISVSSNPPGGITPKQYWYSVGGGESGHIAVDPNNPKLIYAGNYIGQIDRTELDKGHRRNVVAYPQMHDGVAPRDIKYRFQWNAPIRISPHDPNTIYHCSQYVHKSTDGGQSWQVISPDLTTDNDAYHDIPGKPVQHDHTGVELYTTIFAFEESPLEAGVLWAGSDDGRVHLSKDGGTDWKEITPKNMPEEGTVNTIDLSKHEEGRAFMAVYKYRQSDFKPYIFRTNNYGSSWKLLTDGKNGIPEGHFVRVVREDPDRKGLLYAGTEYGMYISFDDGDHWQSFQQNLPVTPITDLQVHRKDLVIATQGRSFWILDNLTPLHSLAESNEEVALFKPRTAHISQSRGFFGKGVPQSAPSGAVIDFFIGEKDEKKKVVLDIKDEEGKLIKRFSTKPDKEQKEAKLEVKNGLNRFIWNMRYPAPSLEPGSQFSLAYTGGATAPPGTYSISLSYGEQVFKQDLSIAKDPKWDITNEDLHDQFVLSQEIMNTLNKCHAAIKQLRSVRKQVNEIADNASKKGFDKSLKDQAKDIGTKLSQVEEELIQIKSESGQDPINYPPKLDDQIAYLYSTVCRQYAKPTEGCYERFNDLKNELKVHLDRLNMVLDGEVREFVNTIEDENVPRVWLEEEE